MLAPPLQLFVTSFTGVIKLGFTSLNHVYMHAFLILVFYCAILIENVILVKSQGTSIKHLWAPLEIFIYINI